VTPTYAVEDGKVRFSGAQGLKKSEMDPDAAANASSERLPLAVARRTARAREFSPPG